MEPVKRLNRELRAKGTVISLYKDTVEVNGHVAEWDYIHHDGAASQREAPLHKPIKSFPNLHFPDTSKQMPGS